MVNKELSMNNEEREEHGEHCHCESDSSGNHSELDEINMLLQGKFKIGGEDSNAELLEDFIGDIGSQNYYENSESKLKLKGFASEAEAQTSELNYNRRIHSDLSTLSVEIYKKKVSIIKESEDEQSHTQYRQNNTKEEVKQANNTIDNTLDQLLDQT